MFRNETVLGLIDESAKKYNIYKVIDVASHGSKNKIVDSSTHV
jgi:hypothetical protein